MSNQCKPNYLSSLLVTCSALLFSTSIFAEQETSAIKIPYLEDARLFAEYTDALPAVINYFTKHSKEEIITFYQNKYGEATKSEMKRGRLTLYFSIGDKTLRVVISQQNNRQQVDALLQ